LFHKRARCHAAAALRTHRGNRGTRKAGKTSQNAEALMTQQSSTTLPRRFFFLNCRCNTAVGAQTTALRSGGAGDPAQSKCLSARKNRQDQPSGSAGGLAAGVSAPPAHVSRHHPGVPFNNARADARKHVHLKVSRSKGLVSWKANIPDPAGPCRETFWRNAHESPTRLA
jgi:hypothetical protein